ncbi:MAG: type III secretion T3S chaperone [Chlamydiae bacterium]|jgi:hypothetical protein|nr:type III secretion T3S chaperone [Chlamydiota bacterium]
MKYPLEQIAQIKVKRLEEAEKLLKEKKRLLEVELEKLKKAEEKRDLVKKHRQDKLEKFLHEMQEGTTSDKIITHERYLKKIVDEELKSEEKKVVDQKKIVTKAEEEVEKARKDRLKKNQDVEKLKLHKTEWEKEALYEEMKKEAIETDEMGSSTHSLKKSARRKEGL